MTVISPSLASRAVACAHWRWVPGMLVGGFRVQHADVAVCSAVPDDGRTFDLCHPSDGDPHLPDPATLGCLLSLVRAAWGEPTICIVYDSRQIGAEWWVSGCPMSQASFPTEAEALVAALEAAP